MTKWQEVVRINKVFLKPVCVQLMVSVHILWIMLVKCPGRYLKGLLPTVSPEH